MLTTERDVFVHKIVESEVLCLSLSLRFVFLSKSNHHTNYMIGCVVSAWTEAGTEAEDKRKIVIIASVTSASSVSILLLVLAALLYRNRRYKRYLQLQWQQSTHSSFQIVMCLCY